MVYRQKNYSVNLASHTNARFARAAAQGPDQLSGHVEVDETYVDGYQKRTKKGQPTNKTIVIGMIERGGTFRGEVIPAATAKRLVPRVLANVAPGSIVNTDSLRSYRTLGKKGFEHVAVNHEIEQWTIGIHHTNTVEGFWKHLKNGICSTHVPVSPKYLGNYVNEFGFHFDNRHEPAQMFQRMLKQQSYFFLTFTPKAASVNSCSNFFLCLIGGAVGSFVVFFLGRGLTFFSCDAELFISLGSRRPFVHYLHWV